MKQGTVLLIGLVVILVVVCFVCTKKESYGHSQVTPEQNVEQDPTSPNSFAAELGVDYEMLDHPAASGFGVGPAGAPGVTPEWTIL